MERDPRGYWLVLNHIGASRPIPRQRVEFAVLTLLTLCDWLTRRDLTRLAVELVTPAPADDTRHRAAFGVPPRFGQPVNRFLMAEVDLLQPIPTHNPSLWALHEQLVEAELGQLGPLGQSLVSAKVRTEISRMLHLGEPRREDVAARPHLTDRTLQRRLQAESVSFQQLLDDTRSELARQYLADPRRGLAEVADQLGFSDQSNPVSGLQALVWHAARPVPPAVATTRTQRGLPRSGSVALATKRRPPGSAGEAVEV